MKVAIMQPYFFPYYLYWKMISEVDKLIILDDVAFIKKGYINRNYIKLNNDKVRIGINIKKISQNKKINEHELMDFHFSDEGLIEESYKNARYYAKEKNIIIDLIKNEEKNLSIYLLNIIENLSDALGFDTRFELASKIDPERSRKGEERIIDLCVMSGANTYFNLPGGLDLYDRNNFLNKGISLKFMEPVSESYYQSGNGFVNNLSIIDRIFNTGLKDTKEFFRS